MKASIFSTILIVIILLLPSTVFAAPYNGQRFELKQPDGVTVPTEVYGDEFYQRVQSLDGYTLVRDPDTNWICYAKYNNDESDFISTGMKYLPNSTMQKPAVTKGLKLKSKDILKKVKEARNKFWFDSIKVDPISNTKTKSSPNNQTPSTTSIRGITILIDFPDVKSPIAKDEIDAWLNQPGYTGYGNDGSIRDYFYDISGHNLEYTNTVTAFYTAKYNKSYYDDPKVDMGIRARELIQEAVQYLDDIGFDFSILSTDSYGNVRGLNVMYAGSPDCAWSRGLWPHKWSMGYPIYIDGVNIYNYQISNIGTGLGFRTFAHENGHLLFGWSDTYDYGFESSGAGAYDLMAYGDIPNPYFRSILAGWSTPIEIHESSNISISANSFVPYIYYNNKNSSEFFMIENIKKTGIYKIFPAEGLLIWHIDKNGSNNNEQMTPTLHYMVSVEQADGSFGLEKCSLYYGDEFNTFRGGYKDKFDESTVPNSNWWNGQESGLAISNISAQSPTDGSMSMDVTVPKIPTGSVSINNDASLTNATVVTLEIPAEDASHMMVSNNSSLWGGLWETYTVTKSWTLSTGDGTKTVYVKFKNSTGNESIVYRDTIILDSTPPTGSLSINNGAQSTSIASVTLNIKSKDSSQMMVSNDPNFAEGVWESYATTKDWTLTDGVGTKKVYIKFEDDAGNISKVYSNTIIIAMPPTGGVSINNDAEYINTINTTLNITATSASQMMISNDSRFNKAKWEKYASRKKWKLTKGDGEKTVFIKFKNTIGIESTAYRDTIILDTKPPIGSVSINDGNQSTYTTSVALTLTATDARQMMISNTAKFSGGAWEDYAETKIWELTPKDGAKTVYIKFIDDAGNTSKVNKDTIKLNTKIS